MLRFSIGINYLGVNHCKVKYSKNSSTTFFFKFEKIYIKVHTQNNSFFLFFLFVSGNQKKIVFWPWMATYANYNFFVWDYFYQMLHQIHWYYCFVVYLGQVYYHMRLSHGCKNLYIFVFPDMSSLCQPILSHLKCKFLY